MIFILNLLLFEQLKVNHIQQLKARFWQNVHDTVPEITRNLRRNVHSELFSCDERKAKIKTECTKNQIRGER